VALAEQSVSDAELDEIAAAHQTEITGPPPDRYI